MSEGQILRFALSIDGGDEDLHDVLRFEIQEGVSEGCRGWVDLYTAEAVDSGELPGKPFRLRVLVDDTEPGRCFHGIIYAASVEAFQPGDFRVRLEVGSRLHLLELGQEVRLFQQKSAREVVEQVLKQADISAASQSWTLSDPPPTRDAITQYNESDLDLVKRLLAEEGIAFAVRSDDDAEKVVFFDGPEGLEPIPGEALLQDWVNVRPDARAVLQVQERHAATPDAVMVRDYDPEHPAVDLSHREEAEGARGREVYVHPGRFEELEDGKRLAKRTLERLRALRVLREGTSDCPFLEPGRTFDLQGHSRLELNGQQCLLSVVHRGGSRGEAGKATADRYESTFRAIPLEHPFRPEAPPERPAPGVEVAFVTGASGQELHGSERGEVKVRFPWDRSGVTDDRSSPWLRVGQLALGGSMIVPRVGFEVLVDREKGDRDRPLVTGHLYNGESPVPYALPDHATRSSIQTATTGGGPGANELRFEDSAGGEEIFLNASHDLTMSVEHDSSFRVKVDESAEVGGNRTFSVGANESLKVGGNRTLEVGANQNLNVGGDLSDSVGGSSQVQVGGTRKLTVGGDFTENTKGALERSVGGLQSVTGLANYERKVAGSVKTSVGAAWLEASAASRMTTCGTARIETVGALKMVKAKTAAVSCGAAYAMTAAAEKVTCGGSRVDKAGAALAITAGGGLSVKAANINITGETKVVLRVGGSVVEVTPTGVKIKSSKVVLKGVKKLGSTAMHGTN